MIPVLALTEKLSVDEIANHGNGRKATDDLEARKSDFKAWQRQAPISRDGRMRNRSSIAATKASAVSWPVIRRGKMGLTHIWWNRGAGLALIRAGDQSDARVWGFGAYFARICRWERDERHDRSLKKMPGMVEPIAGSGG
jgi:hypothetical protein